MNINLRLNNIYRFYSWIPAGVYARRGTGMTKRKTQKKTNPKRASFCNYKNNKA